MAYLTSYKIEGLNVCGHRHEKIWSYCPFCGLSVDLADPASLQNRLVAFLEKSREYGDPFEEANSWYAHEEDMIAFSLLYPSIVFKLSGVGEEPDDIWIKYFKNGHMQVSVGKLVFDPFDESKLM